MGVQRDVGGNPNFPLILLGPAQRVTCLNLYLCSIEVYQNLNCRLTAPLRFLLIGASRMGTLGCRPNLPEGHCPSDSLLRFALVLSQISITGYNP